MASADDVIDRRMASVLFAEAEPGLAAKWMLGLDGRAGIAIARKLVGGSWVGGNAWLTHETLRFRPNLVNRMAHRNAETLGIAIPLGDIRSVAERFGLATRIIDIETAAATLSLRCYRAQAFASAIDAARGAAV